MPPLKRRKFHVNDLRLIKSAESFSDPREPALRIGDRVQLNSGGPTSLVVDLDAETVTLSWQEAEAVFLRLQRIIMRHLRRADGPDRLEQRAALADEILPQAPTLRS